VGIEMIKEAGLRLSRPRKRIYQVMESALGAPLTVQKIETRLVEAGSPVGLRTIYRVLDDFVSKGLLCKRTFGRGKTLFTLNSRRCRVCLVCRKCGASCYQESPEYEDRQRKVGYRFRFQVVSKVSILPGVCYECNVGKDDKRSAS